VFRLPSPRLKPSATWRATEGNEKPAGGEDAANELERRARFFKGAVSGRSSDFTWHLTENFAANHNEDLACFINGPHWQRYSHSSQLEHYSGNLARWR
jgi:hypothetical protein